MLCRSYVAAWLFAATLGGAVNAAGGELPHALVLRTGQLAPHTAVVAGFAAQARVDIEEVLLPEDPAVAAARLEELRGARPRVIVAVGAEASVAARKAFTQVPVVFCMVPYHERYDLVAPNVTGVAISQPISLDLAGWKALMPKVRTVGFVHDPRWAATAVRDAVVAGDGLSVRVIPLELRSGSDIDAVLAAQGKTVDALVLSPDRTAGLATVVKRVLSFAASRQIPVFGHTPAQVKQGALAAFAPDYLVLGQQVGRLVNRLVEQKLDPGALAVAVPDSMELSFNLSTARKLSKGPELPWELLRLAASRGHVLRVYE